MTSRPARHGRRLTDGARVRAIKILSLGLLALLAAAIPPLLAVSNAREGVILGRYTAPYFAFITAYLAGVIAWAGVAAWLVGRLTEIRLTTLQAWTAQHTGRVAAALLAALAAAIGLRATMLARLVPSFPDALDVEMRIIPALFVAGLLAIAGLLLGAAPRARFDAALESSASRLWEGRPRLDVAIGLALPIALMAGLAPAFGLWQAPLRNDPSVHLYLGERVLAGAVPYRDVVYFHPPLRFAISALWSLLGRLTGVRAVDAANALNVLVAAGILVAVYAIGRAYTGRAMGGVLAALLLAGTEYLSEVLMTGPTFRLTTALLMLLAVAAAQRRAWAWAGMLAALTALLWAPAGVIGVALAICALLQMEDRRRALLALLAGAGGVLLATSMLLLALGVLDNALEQNIVALGQVLLERYLTPGSDAVSRAMGEKVTWFVWSLRGEWEIAALEGLGVLATPFMARTPSVRRDPRHTAPILSAVIMLPVFVLEYYGSARDALMLIVLLPPFGAAILTRAVALLTGNSTELRWPALRHATSILMAGMLFVLGAADSVAHQQELAATTRATLADQARMAAELDAALDPDDSVQAVGNLWFATLTSRPNATPFVQWVRLGEEALTSAGWTPEVMAAELERQAPAVVMTTQGRGPGAVAEWLDAHYILLGKLSFDDGPAQRVYVRQGRDDLVTLIDTWALTDDDSPEVRS